MFLEDYNIALMGRKGSGKSTVAKQFIKLDYSFERVSFAGPLKDMIRVFLKSYGLDEETIERMVDGDLKEETIKGLGKSPRQLMQTIGTEWGRQYVHTDVWGRLMSGKIKELHDKGKKFICDDARFDNETRHLNEYDTLMIRVISDNEVPGDGHASETLPVMEPDIIFLNEFGKSLEFSMDELAEHVKELSVYDMLVIYDGDVYTVDYRKFNYEAEKLTFRQVKDLLEDEVE